MTHDSKCRMRSPALGYECLENVQMFLFMFFPRSFPGGSYNWPSLVAQMVKNPAMQEIQVWSLGQEDPWRREWLTHSGILAWRISWTEEPGRSQRVGHNWETNIITFFHILTLVTWWLNFTTTTIIPVFVLCFIFYKYCLMYFIFWYSQLPHKVGREDIIPRYGNASQRS